MLACPSLAHTPMPVDKRLREPLGGVVQYRALQGGWMEKKLSGYDKLSGLGDTRLKIAQL